ncbi:MAG: T9SS type A sorting domain-containing protein [Calditrichota bacterium]
MKTLFDTIAKPALLPGGGEAFLWTGKRMKKYCLVVLSCLLTQVAVGRTIIVAADSTGDYLRVSLAAQDAIAGDSIMVRDGDYPDYQIAIDSGVVVFAEHPGMAWILFGGISVPLITLYQTAQLHGLRIVGNFALDNQTLINIQGGPATIYNCAFFPAARWGMMMDFHCDGRAPMISQCNLNTTGTGSGVAHNYDTTSIWMPYNFYGTLDTVIIHRIILDTTNIHGGSGHVYVSPVLDGFNWLDAPEKPSLTAATLRLTLFPNPFNSTTTLSFSLTHTSSVSLTIFNLLGQAVYQSDLGRLNAGEHRQIFDASELPSGIYLARVQVGEMSKIRKMVLLK